HATDAKRLVRQPSREFYRGLRIGCSVVPHPCPSPRGRGVLVSMLSLTPASLPKEAKGYSHRLSLWERPPRGSAAGEGWHISREGDASDAAASGILVSREGDASDATVSGSRARHG